MKKTLCITVALMLFAALMLSSCGAATYNDSYTQSSTAISASENGNYSAAQPGEAKATQIMDTDSNDGASPNAAQGSPENMPPRKVIQTAQISLETKDFDADLKKIVSALESTGGYIESRTVNSNSIYRNQDNCKNAGITARIPCEKLEETIEAISKICHLTYQETFSEDVTESYYDSKARLTSLEAQEKRLLEILGQAQNLDDVIALEKALSEVRYQIESLTAALNHIDSKVSYSSLSLSLSEVVEYKAPTSTFSDRLTDAFSRSKRNISNWFESTLFYVIADLPSVLLSLATLAIFLSVFYFLGKMLLKKLGWHSRRPSSSKHDFKNNPPPDDTQK